MKKVIALLLLAALMLTLLAACGKQNGFLTAEQAGKVAVKDLGVKESQVEDIHTHGGMDADGTPIFSVHVTVDGQAYEYVIRAADGEILSSGESDGAH